MMENCLFTEEIMYKLFFVHMPLLCPPVPQCLSSAYLKYFSNQQEHQTYLWDCAPDTVLMELWNKGLGSTNHMIPAAESCKYDLFLYLGKKKCWRLWLLLLRGKTTPPPYNKPKSYKPTVLKRQAQASFFRIPGFLKNSICFIRSKVFSYRFFSPICSKFTEPFALCRSRISFTVQEIWPQGSSNPMGYLIIISSLKNTTLCLHLSGDRYFFSPVIQVIQVKTLMYH